jgi:hypothetical protein
MPKNTAIHSVNFHPLTETELASPRPSPQEREKRVPVPVNVPVIVDVEISVYLLREKSSTERVSGLEWG